MTVPISVQQLIDTSKVTGRHRLIVLLLMLTLIAEGLNSSIVPHIFPKLVSEWGVDFSIITTIVFISMACVAVGALTAGRLSDRFGRKFVIITGTAVFAIGTAAIGLSPDITTFGVARAFASFGLGAVVVAVPALVTDIMPDGRRSAMTTLTFTGVTVGGVTGAYLSAFLFPVIGWPPVVLIAAALPLVVLPFVAAFVPESPQLLLRRGTQPQRLRASLATLVPGADVDRVDLVTPQHSESSPFTTVLGRTLLPTTLLLWVVFLVANGVLTVIMQYLPSLLQLQPGPGFTTSESGLTIATLSWGALLGAVVASLTMQKTSRFLAAGAMYVGAVVMTIVIVMVPATFVTYQFVFFLFGFFALGSCAVTPTLASLAYSTRVRGTGVGAATGIGGTAGTLTGGILGGALVGAGIGVSGVLLWLAAPLALAGASVAGLAWRQRKQAAGHDVDAATGFDAGQNSPAVIAVP